MTWEAFALSIVTGLISGGVVSGAFYLLAGRDLWRLRADLVRLGSVAPEALEKKGWIRLTRHPATGEIVGIFEGVEGRGAITFGAVQVKAERITSDSQPEP